MTSVEEKSSPAMAEADLIEQIASDSKDAVKAEGALDSGDATSGSSDKKEEKVLRDPNLVRVTKASQTRAQVGYVLRKVSEGETLTIEALGYSISKAIQLASIVRDRLGEIHLVNSFTEIDDKKNAERKLIGLQIVLSKNALDSDDLGYQKPKPQGQTLTRYRKKQTEATKKESSGSETPPEKNKRRRKSQAKKETTETDVKAEGQESKGGDNRRQRRRRAKSEEEIAEKAVVSSSAEKSKKSGRKSRRRPTKEKQDQESKAKSESLSDAAEKRGENKSKSATRRRRQPKKKAEDKQTSSVQAKSTSRSKDKKRQESTAERQDPPQQRRRRARQRLQEKRPEHVDDDRFQSRSRSHRDTQQQQQQQQQQQRDQRPQGRGRRNQRRPDDDYQDGDILYAQAARRGGGGGPRFHPLYMGPPGDFESMDKFHQGGRRQAQQPQHAYPGRQVGSRQGLPRTEADYLSPHGPVQDSHRRPFVDRSDGRRNGQRGRPGYFPPSSRGGRYTEQRYDHQPYRPERSTYD